MNIIMLILGMGLIRPLSAAILKAEDTGAGYAPGAAILPV